MIIGIGNDIVDVRRIEKTISRKHGSHFLNRVYTENERTYCNRMSNSSPHFAARWALKEAFYKALPEELQPISHWKAIELVREENKKPQLIVLDKKLRGKFRERNINIFHSISHEKEFCTAVVVLESL